MGCICDGMKFKCSRKIEPKDDFIDDPPALTKDEISVIQNNWQVLKIHMANVGVNTFISLFENEPELQNVFSEFRGKDLRELKSTGLLRKHALRVMATLDNFVLHLDDLTFIIPSLAKLGKSHAQSEVPINYLELILPHFLNSIKPYIENHWCFALEEAWSKVFKMIIFYIREGMTNYENR